MSREAGSAFGGKAFVLAAGLGTRLRPLTESQPKVMVEVAGKKILERTITQLKNAGVTELVINTHYFPEAVTSYFGDGSDFGVNIEYSHEPEILGTAGGLKKVEHHFKNNEEFLVVYGDNLFDLDFSKFIKQTLGKDEVGSLLLFDRTKSANSGIAGGVVEIDEQNNVVGFYEAQHKPEINYVNGGIYKLTPEVLNYIPAKTFYDFGKHVFPEMLNNLKKLKGYVIEPHEALFGIDNLESLEKANKYFKQ